MASNLSMMEIPDWNESNLRQVEVRNEETIRLLNQTLSEVASLKCQLEDQEALAAFMKNKRREAEVRHEKAMNLLDKRTLQLEKECRLRESTAKDLRRAESRIAELTTLVHQRIPTSEITSLETQLKDAHQLSKSLENSLRQAVGNTKLLNQRSSELERDVQGLSAEPPDHEADGCISSDEESYESNTDRFSSHRHTQSANEPYTDSEDGRDLTRKNNSLSREMRDLSSDNEILLRVNEGLSSEINSLGIERDYLYNENVKLSDENKNLRAANEKQRLEIVQLRTAYQSLDHQADLRRDHDAKLLNQCTSGLEAVSTFFPMTDEISGGELKEKVEGLNSEIVQQALVIAGALEGAKRFTTQDEEAENSEKQLMKEGFLDWSLIETLRSLRIESYHLQVVLQAAMVHATHRVIMALDPSVAKDPLINRLASGIASTERYPVAAQWRAITHAQLSQLGNAKAECAPLFNNILRAVLTVAGWRNEAKSINFPRRLDRIIDTALELNKAFMQKVFSVQVDFPKIAPQSTFTSEVMEDESAENLEERRPVLCTTGLGLAVRLVDPEATGSPKARWESVLKAKVVTPKVFKRSITTRR